MKERTKHVWKVTVGLLAVALAVVYLVMSGVRFGDRMATAPCHTLRVTVEDSARYPFVSGADVTAYLKSKNVQAIGGGMDCASARRVERVAESMSLVKRAECFRAADGTMRLQVWQRRPRFRVITPLRGYYVDDERSVMPLPDHFAANLPVVSGPVDTALTCGPLYNLVAYIAGHDFWSAHIGEIVVNEKKEVTLVTCSGPSRIELGGLDHYKRKMETVLAWMEQYPDEGLGDKYVSVNVNYEGLLYARKRASDKPATP